MNILITGVAGFIGSHLADRFIADGHRVVGVDNLSTGRHANLHADVDFHYDDISNPRGVYKADGVDLIVHCAASYKDPLKWHRDTKTNVLGTIDMTLLAKAAGCPIVYMQTALPPVSSYAISKTAGMQYIQQSGVPHLIFRLGNIYGPRNLSGPVPTFYKRLTEDQPCTVVDTVRDMVYIDDLVECVHRALFWQSPLRGVYDVCTGVWTPIVELFENVDMALGKQSAYELAQPAADEAMTDVSPDRGVPGWAPTTSLLTGITAAVDWYNANPPAETFTHLTIPESNRV